MALLTYFILFIVKLFNTTCQVVSLNTFIPELKRLTLNKWM